MKTTLRSFLVYRAKEIFFNSYLKFYWPEKLENFVNGECGVGRMVVDSLEIAVGLVLNLDIEIDRKDQTEMYIYMQTD